MFVIPFTSTISMLLIALSVLRFYNISYDSVPVDNLFFWISFAYTFSVTLISFIMLSAVNCRIRGISLMLKDEKDEEKMMEKMKIITKIYVKFFDILNFTNQIFSLNFLMIFSEFKLFAVAGSFLLFKTLSSTITFKDIVFNVCITSYIVILICNVTIIVYFSTMIEQNGFKMLSQLMDRAVQCNDKKIFRYSFNASLHIKRDSLFLTCGLFKLEWKQIFNSFVVVFNFLLIFIQFDSNNTFNFIKK